MSKELTRAIADLRNDIARSGPGLVKVFRDQLTLVLDALEPVELEVGAQVNTTILKGNIVELAHDVSYYGTQYLKGTKGTVMYVYDEEGSYPFKVKIHGTDIEINFNRSEIRKVA